LPSLARDSASRHPPALAGQLDVGNVEASDFVVAVNIAGQTPTRSGACPGTKISGVTIDGTPT